MRLFAVIIICLVSVSVFAKILSIEDNLDSEAKIDVSSYPESIKKLYPVFEARCSKCHSLSRAINADFDEEAYKAYIGKMRRKPNSGINTNDAKDIYLFLKHYTENRK